MSTSSPTQRGSNLYERLTELSPQPGMLRDLMYAWDLCAESFEGPWEMTREQAEEDLAAFLQVTVDED